ncbi:MAG: carboxypeptidase regulatory-like domain-containing protein [Planctomycetes bacterium]|nr:carboxypeptidase regulatory-like domain-containing protein [Planctomycetota bacterium]MCB9918283.1 carboxypeptidase regulatory-like domain-containing protein [Planctomycetota bacterium]
MAVRILMLGAVLCATRAIRAAQVDLREIRHGVVLDRSTRPIANATVTLVGTPLQQYDTPRSLTDVVRVVTEEDGRFSAKVRPELEYDAWASVPVEGPGEGNVGQEDPSRVRVATRDYENAQTHTDVLALILHGEPVAVEPVTVRNLEAWARWAPLRFALRVQGGRSFVLSMRRRGSTWFVPALPPQFGRQFEILASDGRLVHVQPLSRRTRSHEIELLPPLKLRWKCTGTSTPVDIWRLRGYARTYERVATSTDAGDLEYDLARCKYRKVLWPEDARFAFSSKATRLEYRLFGRDECGTADEEGIEAGQESKVMDVHLRQARAIQLHVESGEGTPARGLICLFSTNGITDCNAGEFSAPFELECDSNGFVTLPVGEEDDPTWLVALPRAELRDQLRRSRPLAATWILGRFGDGAIDKLTGGPRSIRLDAAPRVGLRLVNGSGDRIGGATVAFVTSHPDRAFDESAHVGLRSDVSSQLPQFDPDASPPRSLRLPLTQDIEWIVDSAAPLRARLRWPIGELRVTIDPNEAVDGLIVQKVEGIDVLRGKVLGAGDAPQLALVLAYPGLLESRALTDADGAFELRVPSERPIRLVVEVPVPGDRRPETIVIPVGANQRDVIARRREG